jgi:hypothetical protein
MFDTIPDFKIPEAPEGFEYVGMRYPLPHDYMVDFYGNAYLVGNRKFMERWPVYKKVENYEKKKFKEN